MEHADGSVGARSPSDWLPSGEYHPQNKLARTELEQILIPEEASSSDERLQEHPVTTQTEYTPQFHLLFHVNELPQKRKYSRTFKTISLELFFKHPKAYRLLQTTHSLPRISTLYRLCIPGTSLINETVLTALEMKVNLMSTEQRVCAVCVGSMAVAANVQYDAKRDKMVGVHEVEGVQTLEPARTALIITVRGLFHNWKQAVSFSFLGNFHDTIEVKTFIERIISRLFKLGLKVVAYVTDLDTDKMTGVTGVRQLSVTDPTIKIDQNKIYLFYDPLHLLKTVRDSMLTNHVDFLPTNLFAMWSDLVQCYQLDSEKYRLIPFAPKLTQNHINPVPGAMDDLQLTADVFSRETARAISAYIEINAIKYNAPTVTATVSWISIMSKCFDTINFSSTIPSRDKSLVFTGKTAHVEFLVEMLSIFQKVRLFADNPACAPHPRVPPYAKAFRVTINALLLLYRQLKAENCWFPLVGLSLDCLDDFFYKIRKRYDSVIPTSQQVMDCIVKLPVCTIFQYSCRKKQRSNELRMFMSKIRHINDMEMYDDSAVKRDPSDGESEAFSSVQLPAVRCVKQLAQYLLYKAYHRHSQCQLMQQYCSYDDAAAAGKLENPEELHVGITKDSVIVNAVPRIFYEFIQQLETAFKDYFQKKHVTLSMSRLQVFISHLIFEMPCGCFPVDYVKLLYLKCRLSVTLKYNNQLFESLSRDESKRALVVNDL